MAWFLGTTKEEYAFMTEFSHMIAAGHRFTKFPQPREMTGAEVEKMLWDPASTREQFAITWPYKYFPRRMPPFNVGEFGLGYIAKHTCPNELLSPAEYSDDKGRWEDWNRRNTHCEGVFTRSF